MSFVDRNIETRPSRGLAPFKLADILYSRTDDQGNIQAGNAVFSRVSHFDWDEMHGEPHNLLRHPDMPKAVFWLLWDSLQSGKSTGAYIKNKAKDGLYYWVFATIIPCEGGYLSAHIRPTSALLGTIEAEYSTLQKAETEEGLSAQDSAARLLARLAEMGFDDYSLFAAHALSEEIMSRNSGMSLPSDLVLKNFRTMLGNADELLQQTDALVKEFEAMRTIPHNLRVIASRIEPAGGPVTVLSQNYGTMSRDMSEWFEKHVMGESSNFSAIKTTINNSMFVECVARTLKECDQQLAQEQDGAADRNLTNEHTLLAELVGQQTRQAESGQRDVDTEADRILHACNVMHRHFLGLSSTRVLCKIESARLSRDGETLTTIIDQLGEFQARIAKQLDRIAHLSTEIRASDND